MRTRANMGFSLIEVNLAIMMVAVGLLALFALFPLGLRESEEGLADTQEAMFADTILSALEGDAVTVTNWAYWSGPTNDFEEQIGDGLTRFYGSVFNGKTNLTEFPVDSGKYVRYYCRVARIKESDPSRWRATLRVMAGEFGDFSANATTFYTEFVFLGL